MHACCCADEMGVVYVVRVVFASGVRCCFALPAVVGRVEHACVFVGVRKDCSHAIVVVATGVNV